MDSAEEEEKTALLAPGSVVSSQSYVGTGAGKGGKQDSDEEEERPGEEHDEEEHDEEEEPTPYKNENDLFTYQLRYMRFLSGCCCQNTAFWNPTPWTKCIGCVSDNQLACFTYKTCMRMDQECLSPTGSRPDGTICFLGLGCCGMGLKNPFNPEVTCIKNQSQLCCIANGCALPTVKTVPVTCGCCCMSCHPRFGCCHNFKLLSDAANKKGYH